MAGLFVYCICGDDQLAKLNTSLRFLKHSSRAEIVLVRSRSSGIIEHDQVLNVNVPGGLSNREAVLYLKTSLPSLVTSPGKVCCYLDTDQIAVSDEVDQVFGHYYPPITFARDHISIDEFSRCAVRCGCPHPPCAHLREAIWHNFRVSVPSPGWRHWNGGLFLFDEASFGFASRWREYTLLALDDPFWESRDQGTLAATAWSLGLELHAVIPRRFNYIVDRFRGRSDAVRDQLRPADYSVDQNFDLGVKGSSPVFVHLINDGVNRPGWANWDQIEATYQKAKSQSSTK